MNAAQVYQTLGVLAIIFSWIAGFCLVRKWPSSQAKSLSLHAAAHRRAYLLFGVTLTCCGLVFYIFALDWLIPNYDLSLVFKFLITVCLACQLIIAWVPDSDLPTTPQLVRYRKIHRIAAYSLAALLPFLLALILLSPHVSKTAQMIIILALTGMVTFAYMYRFLKSSLRYYLYFQSAYLACFHAAILGLVFFR
jgi:hypothetical protein